MVHGEGCGYGPWEGVWLCQWGGMQCEGVKTAGSTVQWSSWCGMSLALSVLSTSTQEIKMERVSGSAEGLPQESKEENREDTCPLVTSF